MVWNVMQCWFILSVQWCADSCSDCSYHEVQWGDERPTSHQLDWKVSHSTVSSIPGRFVFYSLQTRMLELAHQRYDVVNHVCLNNNVMLVCHSSLVEIFNRKLFWVMEIGISGIFVKSQGKALFWSILRGSCFWNVFDI